MTPEAQKSGREAKVDNLFFVIVLVTLIGCTLASGGTAIVLASGMLNEQSINVAQGPLSAEP